MKLAFLSVVAILVAACASGDGSGTGSSNQSNKAWRELNEGRIVFASDRGGTFQIYVMDAQGANVVQLTDDALDHLSPVWSPDGSRIAFTAGTDTERDVYVMDADGGNVRQITKTGAVEGELAWAPDGKRIAYLDSLSPGSEDSLDVYVVKADGSDAKKLTDLSGTFSGISWSPDGKSIAFAYGPRPGGYDIYVMDADGSVPRGLTFDEVSLNPAWSPDGSRIAFESAIDQVRDPQGGNHRQIWTMGPDGSDADSLTYASMHLFSPRWSSDGTRLLVLSEGEGDDFEIYVINAADGSEVAQLTDNAARDMYADWCCAAPLP